MDLNLLERLTNAFGPSGHEGEVQMIVKEYGQRYADDVQVDNLGSVIMKKGSSGPRLILAGHGDEIGFVIREIEDNGFLRIHNLGGVWAPNMISQQIIIKPFTGTEKIIGVIVSKAFWAEEHKGKSIPLKDLMVDIGCKSKKEVEELGIRVGDPAVPYAFFRTMKRSHIEKENGDEKRRETTLAVAKAFDNRIGVFIALQVLKRLKEEGIEHPNTVYFVSTVQEEVGVRGAKTMSNMVQPDIGFALDVDASGDVPGAELIQTMGKGVTISAGDSTMVPNPKLRKKVIQIAEENNIKWQPAFLPFGGTDAGAMHVSGIGAPSLFIGISTRHIHSHQAILDLEDVENAITLMVNVVKSLDAATVQSFTQL